MNKESIEQTKQFLREEPRRFYMDGYKIDFQNLQQWAEEWLLVSDLPATPPPCGTIRCLCGTVNHLIGNDHIPGDEQRVMMALLGMNDNSDLGRLDKHGDFGNDFFNLFHEQKWPEELYFRYSHAKDEKERVEIACEVLDLFAEGKFV